MKRVIFAILVLSLILCGCSTVQTGEESTTENTAIHSSDMPEIKKEAKASRWHEEFTDTLIPREDYGELAIFMGGYCHDESNGYSNEQRFGLMTLDGKIVVDPVFNSYRTYELDGKKYYNMKITENELYEGGEYSCTSMLVTSDGSWCVTVDGDIDHITPERIFTSKYDEHYKCYDYDGNLIFSGEEGFSYAWNRGTSSHTRLMGAYNFYEDDNPLLVFDMNGNVVFDEFSFFVSFESGKSVVRVTETGLYGIITDSGEWLLEPDFNEIESVEDEYFVAVLDNTVVDVYDKDLNLVHAFTTEDYDAQSRYYEIVDGRLLYYCGHIDAKDDYYRDMFTDEIITCRENGMPATRYSEEDAAFSLTDADGTDWYFDVDGNVIDKVELPEGADEVTLLSNDIIKARTAIDEQRYTETYYDKETGEKICSFTGAYEDIGFIDFLEFGSYEKLAIKSDIVSHIEIWYDCISRLVNCKTGEVFLEGCENIEISEYGGKRLLTVAYTDYIYIYDEDFNLVIGVENALYD